MIEKLRSVFLVHSIAGKLAGSLQSDLDILESRELQVSIVTCRQRTHSPTPSIAPSVSDSSRLLEWLEWMGWLDFGMGMVSWAWQLEL